MSGRRAFFRILGRTGLLEFIQKRNQKADKVPVLVFHRVHPDTSDLWSPLHPDVFERIIHFLSLHYRFRPLEDLFSDDSGSLRNACFITFDDAFEDFHQYALPILEKYDVPTTLFVPTGSIRTGEVIWPIRLAHLIGKTGEGSLEWEGRTYLVRTRRHREQALKDLEEIFRKKDPGEQEEGMAELEKKAGLTARSRPMTREQLQELPPLVRLQPHSVSHPYFPESGTFGRIREELQKSRAELEAMTGRTHPLFAYPFGAYDDRTLKEASACYEAAFSVDERSVDLSSDLKGDAKYRIPRFNMHDPDPWEIWARINGVHTMLKKLMIFR